MRVPSPAAEPAMPHRPSFDEFAALSRGHTVVPVFRRLVADALTPVSAFAAVKEPGGAFLFESVVGGERVGRYSFLGAGPFKRIEASGERVRVQDGAGPWVESSHPDPLKVLEDLVAGYRGPHLPGLPRFCGGAVGYAGYDTVRYVERLPNAPPDDRGVPDLSFAFHDRMVIFDHINKTVLVVALAHVGQADLRAAYDDACRRTDELVERLTAPSAELPPADIDPTAGRPPADRGVPARYQSNMTR
jgi:anthranilate synthase component I